LLERVSQVERLSVDAKTAIFDCGNELSVKPSGTYVRKRECNVRQGLADDVVCGLDMAKWSSCSSNGIVASGDLK